jgi:hypothetical protein
MPADRPRCAAALVLVGTSRCLLTKAGEDSIRQRKKRRIRTTATTTAMKNCTVVVFFQIGSDPDLRGGSVVRTTAAHNNAVNDCIVDGEGNRQRGSKKETVQMQ